MKSNSFLIVMTACINPQIGNTNENCKLTRVNAELRLSDYITALRYWINYKDERIKGVLFVENSGYDLTKLINEKETNPYNREIEFVQYSEGVIPEGLHYGYAELDMIDKVFFDSLIIEKYNFIIKVTGRLFFPKLSRLLDSVNTNNCIIIDSRDYSFPSEEHYCLTTLFVTNLYFYKKHLYNRKVDLTKEKPYIEHLFFQIIKPLYLEHELGIIMRFPINISPCGIGAHSNKSYSSFIHKTKCSVRSLFRHLFPNIWI